MLKPKVEAALNKQINEEFYSSYLYLAMAAYFESKNLTGFANWMKIQSEEEYLHAMKFYTYVNTAGGKVVLESIKKPKSEWKSIIEVFEETLQHEIHITECINDIASLSIQEKDHATGSFLKWFIDEQVEEVAIAEQLLEELKMIGDDKNGIFMINRELAQRPPAISAATAN